jgi:hypothetical protein
MKTLVPFLLVLTFLFCTAAVAQEADSTGGDAVWSGGLELSTGNKYMWRGIPVSEGVISQPDAWLTYKDFTFEFWGSFTLQDDIQGDNPHEINGILTYEYGIGNFSVENTFYYYHYINQPGVPATGELSCNIGYPLGAFKLIAGVNVDVIEYSGATSMLEGIELETDLNDQFSLDAALTLGSGFKKFNEAYIGLSRSTLTYLCLDIRPSYNMTNGIYVQPYVQLFKTLDSALADYLYKNTSSFGLIVGKEF